MSTCLPSLVPPPSYNTTPVIAKPDSRASNMYWIPEDKHILHGLKYNHGPVVNLPNGFTIQSNEIGNLPIPDLSPITQQCHVLPELQSASLISVGKLCNDDCIVTFDKSHVYVSKNNKLILKGNRNLKDNLWDIPLPQPAEHHANVIICKDKPIKELIQYYQGCCFSPTK